MNDSAHSWNTVLALPSSLVRNKMLFNAGLCDFFD